VDNRAGWRQADAAAAGALLVDDDEEDDDVDDPESGFFDDDSEEEEEELLASLLPLDADDSADTFSFSFPEPPDAFVRLSVR
jgi:hypothetical protein